MAMTSHAPKSVVSRGNARWLMMGGVRLLYRWWTRIAVHAFPEDSAQAHLAERIGLPLPDQLNLSWVTRFLAVGGRVKSEDIALLSAQGVKAVVDTRSEHVDDEAALNAHGIELLHLPTPDTYPLSVEDLHRGAEWVNTRIAEGKKVLIHCEHGVGRSVLLTAASLVAAGYDAHAAITLIEQRRWQAAPNHRQLVRLTEFERAERARSADEARV